MIKKCLVFALIVWSCIACRKANEPILECIIDAYIVEFSMRLGDEISLFETKGWSDTTSILSVRTISSDRLENGRYWFSKYKGADLYLSQGELLEDGDLKTFFDKERIISNNLTWEVKQIKNPTGQEGEIVPPEEFDEVQIVYNQNMKCIMETEMMGRNKFKERINLTCGFCRSQ